MKKLSCPSCGAEVRFQSAASVSTVCAYCASLLVRHDLDLELVGKTALLQEDVSPFQIGTSGSYEKRSFCLIGRLCQKWESGTWNEWFALFDDGTTGWLAEAQGFYMMSFEKEIENIPERKNLTPGCKVTLAKVNYQVDDIKNATCVSVVGELPLIAKIGRRCTSIDLTGEKESFGCLDYSEEGVRFYAGRYLNYDEFKFSNVREIDGW